MMKANFVKETFMPDVVERLSYLKETPFETQFCCYYLLQIKNILHKILI